MDKIIISALRVNTIIGTLPHERLHRQELLIDMEIRTPLGAAALSDDLNDTVNYAEIEERAAAIAEGSSFLLIEALAGAIGRMIMEYPAVAGCTVRINKPRALKYSRCVAVEIDFDR